MPTHRVRAGTFADGLYTMTDAAYAEKVDNSPRIADAYKALGRISQPTRNTCAYASVFGIKSRISGPTKGDSPAVAYGKRISR